MKFKRFLFALFVALAFTVSAAAQEVEVDRYNITVKIDLAASAIDARAAIAVSNLSPSPKTRLYFMLAKLAKVSAATVNDATAQVETTEDRRIPALNQIIVSPERPLAPGANATVEITYRLETPETTPLASVDAGEILMTPDAVWFPMPSTMFTIYGATSAPFTLSVTAPNDFQVASSGAMKANGQTFTFEQSLNSLPFIIAGRYDQPLVAEHGGIKVEVLQQPSYAGSPESNASGSAEETRKQAARLSEEAGRIIAFLTKTLGPPPAGATFRIISSPRLGNLAVPGAFVLDHRIMRQSALDAGTIEWLADAIARTWTEGRVRLRGQAPRAAQPNRPAQPARSVAILRDSLPHYLAALYFEDRFGKDAGWQAFERMRANYTPIAKAKRDAELDIQIPLSTTYTTAVFNKGPLVLRLLAETIGRDKMTGILRQLFAGGQTKIVDLEDFRQALAATGPEIDALFAQWIDTIIEPDVIIGIPQPSDQPGVQRVNLRNLGKGDVKVRVLAITESGKQINTSIMVPSEDIVSADIQTAEKIVSVEADPEKLIIQTDYDNDAKPARTSADTILNESILAFSRGEHAQAEEKLREGVRAYPQNAQLHAWLARTLAARNKLDEAVTEANAAIKIEPPMVTALAWAHITLGHVALARNQPAQAVEPLRRAVIEAVETPAQYAAREALARAERAAGAGAPVEESLRAFISQLDSYLKQPSSDQLFTIVSRNTLKQFVQRLAVTPPTGWTTEVLRVDYLDANFVALDVAIKAVAGGREQSGTAVLIARRSGSGWMLDDVQLFNVK